MRGKKREIFAVTCGTEGEGRPKCVHSVQAQEARLREFAYKERGMLENLRTYLMDASAPNTVGPPYTQHLL